MTYLITILCVLVSLIILAGGFILAKYVVTVQHDNKTLTHEVKMAAELVAEQAQTIEQLRYEIEYMKKISDPSGQQAPMQRSWNPGDPLNQGERVR